MSLGSRLSGGLREVVPGMKPARKPSRPNPWPKCDVCMHRVPSLCPECVWCASCCLGHNDEKGPRQ